jgi:hypothetical protein
VPPYPGNFMLISSWSEVQCWRSKCQMWAVPSLLPETKRSPWLAHWMLSTRSECASFSRMRCGPSSPTIRYTLQDKWFMLEINDTQRHSYHFIKSNNNPPQHNSLLTKQTALFCNRGLCWGLQKSHRQAILVKNVCRRIWQNLNFFPLLKGHWDLKP